MKLIIRRNSNILSGAMIKSKVWINGEFSGKIAHGEEQELSLSKNNSVVQVKQFSGKSNKLVVSDGDAVEISHTPWLLWVYLFLFVLVVSFQILDLVNTPIYYIVILITFLALYRGIELFKLTKLQKTQ